MIWKFIVLTVTVKNMIGLNCLSLILIYDFYNLVDIEIGAF